MRLICSPSLTQDDIDAIERGEKSREQVSVSRIDKDIQSLLSDAEMTGCGVLLATLVQCSVLDVRIATPITGTGLYHDKLGVFTDQHGDQVSFRGSLNETLAAWHQPGNFESFEVFRGWAPGSEASRVSRHVAYVETLWSNDETGVLVFTLPEASRQHLLTVAKPSLHDLTPLGRDTDRRVRVLRRHQEEVLANWKKAGRRGIVCHATGSGKTFTALHAIREHVSTGGVAVVVVPGKILHEQWSQELRGFIPSLSLLRAGNDADTWRQSGRLRLFLEASKVKASRVVLSTMQTAATSEFVASFREMQNLLLVADEVHQVGSPSLRRLLAIDAAHRLGLSATPERYGDPMGTGVILNYFGQKLLPKFGLADAIAEGTLVPYRYEPATVELNQDEADEWAEVTKEIVRLVARQHSSPSDPSLEERIALLNIARARIAKKALNKIAYACDLVEERFEHGHRWLVYAEDSEQLRALRAGLSERGIQSMLYLSGMDADGPSALRWFRKHGGVMLSVRCLDEGVDIPETTHALVLASSQNPRQFIQRRGRVLRTHPGKAFATVFDALVLPPSGSAQDAEIPAFTRADLNRAREFADFALNQSAAATLRELVIRLGGSLAFEDVASAVEPNDSYVDNIHE